MMRIETQQTSTFLQKSYGWFKKNLFLPKPDTQIEWGGNKFFEGVQAINLKLHPETSDESTKTRIREGYIRDQDKLITHIYPGKGFSIELTEYDKPVKEPDHITSIKCAYRVLFASRDEISFSITGTSEHDLGHEYIYVFSPLKKLIFPTIDVNEKTVIRHCEEVMKKIEAVINRI